jgi:hypothetical protein
MPTFRFPRAESLRLALAAGVVPHSVARAPATGATTADGSCWVAVPDFPAPSAVALSRLGVSAHSDGATPPLRRLVAWAELVPPKPTALPPPGRVLLVLPDRALQPLVDRLARLGGPAPAWRLVAGGRAAVVADRLPPHLADGAFEAFGEVSPGVWVAAGFAHPLAATVVAKPGRELLIPAAGAWRTWREFPRPTDTPRVGTVTTGVTLPELPRHDVVLRPVPTPAAAAATLCLVPGGCDALAGLLRDAPEALLRKYRVAQFDGIAALLAEPGSVPPVADAPGLRAFAPHPQCATLFVPAGHRLAPPLRPRALAGALGVGPGHLTLFTSDGPVHIPLSAFRKLADAIDYAVPPAVAFRPVSPSAAWAALPAFVAESIPPAEAPARPRPASVARSESGEARPHWLSRLLPARPRKRGRPPQAPVVTVLPELPADRERLREKLASPQALVLGNDWAVRRRALERRVLADLPTLPPAERVALWADLGAVCDAFGDAGEAAICWRNAAWDGSPDGPEAEAWLRAECRAARMPADGITAEKLLAAPDTAVSASAAVAFLARGVAASADEVGRLLARVAAHEAELPARGVWLARLGAARVAGGDPLGLAAARDRLLARLGDRGAGLDLDAPAFLRFRGVVGGERLPFARDWLLAARDPIRRWLGKLDGPGRLQWAGLDGETIRTAAYADLMLAWAFARLGDRGHAKQLEAQAARALAQPPGPGADARVHSHLLALFRGRIRQAQEGRDPAGVLPTPAGLDDLGRYAIDALRRASRALEPHETVDPFDGRDTRAFLGSDALGARLAEFVRPRSVLRNPGDARRLLALDEADATAATMPRVVFALLEVAPALDPLLVAAVVPQAVRAVDLIPEWVRLAGLPGDPAALTQRFGRRMLLVAAHAATHFRLAPSLRAATEDLIERIETPDGPAARLFEGAAGPYFRALARLGLGPFAALLLARLRPGDGPVVGPGPRELGLAVGQFAAGHADAGNATLDAARHRLLVTGVRDDRDRTATALAYAAALEHAAPRVALGRLQELFLRLDMVTATGATNRYFTLAPLALVDTALRAVVGEDSALGPRVRAWLDDDEFLTRRRVARDLAEALRRL